MDVLINSLKNGKGTDERLFTIENQLRVIQQKYNSLITFEPVVDDTAPLIIDEPNESREQLKQFFKNI